MHSSPRLLLHVLPPLPLLHVYDPPQPSLTVPHLLAQASETLVGVQTVPLPHCPGVAPPPQVSPFWQAVIGLDSQLISLPQPSSTRPQVLVQAWTMPIGTQAGGGGSTHLPLFAPVPQILPLAQPLVMAVQSKMLPQPSPAGPHAMFCCAQVSATQVGAVATQVLRAGSLSVSTQRWLLPQLTPPLAFVQT